MSRRIQNRIRLLADNLYKAERLLDGLAEQYEWLDRKGLIEIGVDFVPSPKERELREQVTSLMDWMVMEVPKPLREGVRKAEKSLSGWRSQRNYLRGVNRDSLQRRADGEITLVVPAGQIEVRVVEQFDVVGRPGLVDLLLQPTAAGWERIDALWDETREIEARLADENEVSYWESYISELDEKVREADRLRIWARELVAAFEYAENKSTGEFEARFNS